MNFGHCLQVKAESFIRGGNFFLVLAVHFANHHRVGARNIEIVDAERRVERLKAVVVAQLKVQIDFPNLNIAVKSFIEIFFEVVNAGNIRHFAQPDFFQKIRNERLFAVFVLEIAQIAVEIVAVFADVNINQPVQNMRGNRRTNRLTQRQVERKHWRQTEVFHNFTVPDFAPHVRGDKAVAGGFVNQICEQGGGGGVEAVQNDNAVMFSGGENYASHCAELEAADTCQNVNRVHRVGVVNIKNFADNFQFIFEAGVGNI